MPMYSKKMKLPNGKVVELFYISTLAMNLGRTPATVRKWEISGVIPPALFKDSSGNRMYTREQIDCIVKCAEDAKITGGKSLHNTSFSSKCYKRLEELNKQYK